MSDAKADDAKAAADAPKKGGKKGLILVVLLALAAGGGAFFVTWSGLLGGTAEHASDEDGHAVDPDGEAHAYSTDGADGHDAAAADGDGHGDGHGADAGHADAGDGHGTGGGHAFLELAPIAVSIGAGGADRQLRMQAYLDLDPAHEAEVAALEPRIRDALLGYLRALEPAVLGEPTALLRVRSQMLRRARMIVGDEAVTDLLVTDFVLN